MTDQQIHRVTMTRPDLDELNSQLAEWRDELLRVTGDSLGERVRRGQIEMGMEDALMKLILYADALEAELEALDRFHPRAMKLMRKLKNFVVVAEDEPYFLQVYALIRSHQGDQGTWSDQDERVFQDYKVAAFPLYKPPEPIGLGKRIKAERLARGLTTRELSDRAGLRFTRLEAIVSGLYVPPADDELRRIAEALGITVEALREDVS